MHKYIGSDNLKYARAWEITVAKARSIVRPAVPFPTEKNIMKVEIQVPILTPESLKEAENTIIKAVPEKPRFCEQCDSKGVAHKKECPTRSIIVNTEVENVKQENITN